MDHFHTKNGRMRAEDVDLAGIAERFGTPCYVYSRATLERHQEIIAEFRAGAVFDFAVLSLIVAGVGELLPSGLGVSKG